MKRLLPFLASAIAFVPLAASAVNGDAYADAVYQASNHLYRPLNALGAPDQVYADFFDQDASVILDMGAGEEGTGDLTVSYVLLDFGAGYRVEFLDVSFSKLQESRGAVPLSQSAFVVDYASSTPYRYVSVTSTEDEQWRLDAIEAETVSLPPPTEEPSLEPTEEGVPRGLLVKLPDDGNPATDMDSAVYVIGGDGKRHAFPSLQVYRSWYADFSEVAYIDAEHLASYPLGGNVTVRPGTYLVKLTTDPKVYAVEPGGVLRWVPSEAVAVALHGPDWSKRVIDVADVFFGNYQPGPDLNDLAHPDGTIGFLPSGQVVYVENATSHAIASMSAFRFRQEFVVAISQALADLYVDGGTLEEDPDIKFPY